MLQPRPGGSAGDDGFPCREIGLGHRGKRAGVCRVGRRRGPRGPGQHCARLPAGGAVRKRAETDWTKTKDVLDQTAGNVDAFAVAAQHRLALALRLVWHPSLAARIENVAAARQEMACWLRLCPSAGMPDALAGGAKVDLAGAGDVCDLHRQPPLPPAGREDRGEPRNSRPATARLPGRRSATVPILSSMARKALRAPITRPGDRQSQ